MKLCIDCQHHGLQQVDMDGNTEHVCHRSWSVSPVHGRKVYEYLLCSNEREPCHNVHDGVRCGLGAKYFNARVVS